MRRRALEKRRAPAPGGVCRSRSNRGETLAGNKSSVNIWKAVRDAVAAPAASLVRHTHPPTKINVRREINDSGVRAVADRLREEGITRMRYVPKTMQELLFALETQPENRKVEADTDTGISALTVKDLRLVPFWPDGLVLIAPSESYPELIVKIRKR